MNVFILSKDTRCCAEYHCDKHVVKMLLEYTQLLCGAVVINGGEAPYKLTHKNHPCAIWARSNIHNWLWLRSLAVELGIEYTKRYEKIHKCISIIENLEVPNLSYKILNFNVQAMPDIYKKDDVVEAYRAYYIGEKNRFAKWKLGNVPYWFL